MDFLLRILLWRNATGDGGSVEGIRLPRCDSPGGLLLFLGLLAVGIWLIRLGYRRDAGWVTPERKRRLVALRAGALAIVLFIASGAVADIAGRFEGTGTVMLLVDRSKSMGLVDRREGAAQSEAAAVLGDAAAKATRQDLLAATWRDAKRDPLRKLAGRFAVEAYAFGESPGLAPLSLTDGPEGPFAKLGVPTERATQLGAGLADAARRARGRRLDAVIVATDGGWNRGEDPIEAAKALGAPVIAVGVGAPQSRDLEVPFLFCEDVVFKNDRFPLEVRIRQRGMTGRTVPLVVKRIDEEGREEVVAEQQVAVGEEREITRIVDIVPDREGVFTWTATIAAQPEEANTVNNTAARANVRVVDRKLRVLLIDESPRWEFRFLRSILAADRQRVQSAVILRQGDRSAAGKGEKLLRQFPNARELKEYDSIVLGDVRPDFFTAEELKTLEAWVRADGGGLTVVAGRRAMPGAWAGTVLDQLLPVEPEAIAAPSVAEEQGRSLKDTVRLAVTPEGTRWAALRWSPDAGENELMWRDAAPLAWTAPVKRLKSGAAALLVDPQRMAADGGMPVLAAHRYGRGQVAWVGTDCTWRWRFKPGAIQHRRLWGQLVASLGMAHLMGNASRVQVETDRGDYAVGDKVQIIARVLDNDFNPLLADSVTATVERDMVREKVALAARRDQPGMFTGEWAPKAAGRVRIVVDAGADAADERQVTITEPQLEQDDGGMREDLLRAIAQSSSGAFVSLAESATIAELVNARQRPAALKRSEVTLWNAPMILLLLVSLLGIEWWFRKRWDML